MLEKTIHFSTIRSWRQRPVKTAESLIEKEEVYKRFFHGPSFQILNAVDKYYEGYLEADIESDKEEAPFKENDTCLLDSRPMAIEAAFQAAGLWTMIVHNKISLPFKAKRIEFYRLKSPASSVNVTYRNQLNGGPSKYIFDVLVKDDQAQPVLKVEQMTLIEMEELPEAYRLNLKPGIMAQEPVFTEKMIDLSQLQGQVDSDDRQSLLDLLHPEETKVFDNFKVSKRAWEWLGGRIAGKEALRHYIRNARGEDLRLNEIIIDNDEMGKPLSNLNGVHLSISHKGSLAIAGVCDDNRIDGIGVDLEMIEPREKHMWEQFFSHQEQKLAFRKARENNTEESHYFTHIWAIKEAVLKSMGIGLRVDTRQIEVVDISPEGKAELAFHDLESDKELNLNADNHVEAWIDQNENYVIARSVLSPDQADQQ